LKDAMHTQCKGCHAKDATKKAPTKCDGCHTSRQPAIPRVPKEGGEFPRLFRSGRLLFRLTDIARSVI